MYLDCTCLEVTVLHNVCGILSTTRCETQMDSQDPYVWCLCCDNLLCGLSDCLLFACLHQNFGKNMQTPISRTELPEQGLINVIVGPMFVGKTTQQHMVLMGLEQNKLVFWIKQGVYNRYKESSV